MPELTEMALLRDLTVAQRVRIAELEQQLKDASASLHRAGRSIREVLDGAGASLEEKLHASVALAETQALLDTALSRPTPTLPRIRKLALVRRSPPGAAGSPTIHDLSEPEGES